MKRITLIITLVLACTFSYAQEKHSRIKINNPTERVINTIATQGIDLKCGAKHEGEDLIIDISETEINSLKANNVSYRIVIDDIAKFYSDKARIDLPNAKAELKATQALAKTSTNQKSSVSSTIMDNIIQYTGCDEIDFVEPQNFKLGDWAGCLTFREMKDELDDMYTYSQANGLNIVSQKANASSIGQKTWGNPSTTIVNPQNNGPSTYSGQGNASSFENQPDRDGKTFWDPETIYYVRITGNQSGTPENTKPQMLFTSMIHSREVSALMNNMYFMWYLIENYNTDLAVKELVDNNELYFIPVVNPDGLKWNEHLDARADGLVDDGSQFQRKNLRPNTGGTANTSSNRGVDLNRNFDYYWGYNNVGSSGTGADGTYRGPSAESEPETQIMVDFINNRNIKSSVWNHSFANSVPHPYGGEPTDSSGREDEYYRWHEEMTRYNRYLYGATIFYESNGLPDDWMMGGVADNNNSTGSGQAIIATTPEHGGEGFWPTVSTIVPIAKRSMRISLATAYYGGKYAKLHDLTQSDLNGTTANLDFGIERIGQTGSDFTVTVTPISSNITGVTQAGTETGMPVLQQRTVTAQLQLASGIPANSKIEYNVKLSNDNGIIYEVNYEKYYNPTLLLNHEPDANALTDNWTQTGGWINTSADAYSGNNALRTGNSVPYASSNTKRLTTTNGYDFTTSDEIIIQFYAKWDLERNYDYVEVLASKNGSTWIPLCGKYTKPEATSSTTSHDNKSTGATFQSGSSGQVYDGDRMDNWVMEEFSINPTDNATLLQSDATNVQIRFNFRTDDSDVSENYSTTSDGYFIDDFKIISIQVPCVTSVPTNISSSAVSDTEATINWDAATSATYDLRYRVSGTTTWTNVLDITSPSYTITGLTAETQYDVRIRSKCDSTTSNYSPIYNFTTNEVSYCASQGNSVAEEFIGRVQLNDLDNNTSATTTSGYSDFTSMIVDITKNTTPTITITKIWPGTSQFNEAVVVWIDFNKDGDFDDAGEEVISSAPTQNIVTGNITIPAAAIVGNTTMRVSMKYNALPTSCESFSFGEVEDYTVNIKEQTLSVVEENTLENISIYPNPFNDNLSIKIPYNLTSYTVELYDIRGRLIYNTKKVNSPTRSINIGNLETLSQGAYLLKITDLNSNKSTTKKLLK